eukprot:TRINITY_DN804_c1_g1_i1.p1 TRINITY_DN804_c1_g1~~TRINITY_DN804_c1_g1_i1.p1  ORF type:complete len:256 (+),score=10.64 TRINITY_DN804_c1_g1_i1:50-769(+)
MEIEAVRGCVQLVSLVAASKIGVGGLNAEKIRRENYEELRKDFALGLCAGKALLTLISLNSCHPPFLYQPLLVQTTQARLSFKDCSLVANFKASAESLSATTSEDELTEMVCVSLPIMLTDTESYYVFGFAEAVWQLPNVIPGQKLWCLRLCAKYLEKEESWSCETPIYSTGDCTLSPASEALLDTALMMGLPGILTLSGIRDFISPAYLLNATAKGKRRIRKLLSDNKPSASSCCWCC